LLTVQRTTVSKAILAKAVPPGRAPGFYSFRRFRKEDRVIARSFIMGVQNLYRRSDSRSVISAAEV
jgi:hypothetical protein